MLTFDERVDHPRAERARPVERHHSNQVTETGRLEFDQVFFHPGRFQLEDTGCFTTAE